jgi:hypothetical protein
MPAEPRSGIHVGAVPASRNDGVGTDHGVGAESRRFRGDFGDRGLRRLMSSMVVHDSWDAPRAVAPGSPRWISRWWSRPGPGCSC